MFRTKGLAWESKPQVRLLSTWQSTNGIPPNVVTNEPLVSEVKNHRRLV